MDSIEVAVSGAQWMGGGVGAIRRQLVNILSSARQEVILTAYSVTEGAEEVLGILEECLDRGVEVKIVVNRLSEQPESVQRRFRRWANRYEHFSLFDLSDSPDSDLHAKVVVVDRSVASVGSSNFSRRGLLMNYELAVVVTGPTASTLGQVLDRLFAITRPVGKG